MSTGADAASGVYEVTILVDPGRAQSDYEGTLAAVRGIFETEGAEWMELEKWDERKLAYPIKGHNSALYLVGFFRAPRAAITPIERRCELSEDVLRQLMIARHGNSYDRICEQRAKAQEARAAAAAAASRED